MLSHFLKEEEEARARVERASHEINAPLRGMLLRDYVNKIRTTYHEEKRREKLKKIHDATEKYVLFSYCPFITVCDNLFLFLVCFAG